MASMSGSVSQDNRDNQLATFQVRISMSTRILEFYHEFNILIFSGGHWVRGHRDEYFGSRTTRMELGGQLHVATSLM